MKTSRTYQPIVSEFSAALNLDRFLINSVSNFCISK